MAFQKLPDNRGLVYIPEACSTKKKNPCPDCFSCQMCSNERCRSCRPENYLKILKKQQLDVFKAK